MSAHFRSGDERKWFKFSALPCFLFYFVFLFFKLNKLKDYKDITAHRKLLFEFDLFGFEKHLGDFFGSKELKYFYIYSKCVYSSYVKYVKYRFKLIIYFNLEFYFCNIFKYYIYSLINKYLILWWIFYSTWIIKNDYM